MRDPRTRLESLLCELAFRLIINGPLYVAEDAWRRAVEWETCVFLILIYGHDSKNAANISKSKISLIMAE